MSSIAYQRDGEELFHHGLYLDMREWGITFLHWRRFEMGTDGKRTSPERTGEQP